MGAEQVHKLHLEAVLEMLLKSFRHVTNICVLRGTFFPPNFCFYLSFRHSQSHPLMHKTNCELYVSFIPFDANTMVFIQYSGAVNDRLHCSMKILFHAQCFS